MLEFLTLGLVLGLAAGLAPGPLLVLVVTETLRRGTASGIRVALAPVLTDLPIVALVLLVLSRLRELDLVLGLIALAGSGFLVLMARDTLLTRGLAMTAAPPTLPALTAGMLANGLSPHPYLFWLSVGGPLLERAAGQGVWVAVGFVLSFYACLIGAKIAVALGVGRSRHALTARPYLLLMRGLGLLLLLLALLLLRDGLRLLGLFG